MYTERCERGWESAAIGGVFQRGRRDDVDHAVATATGVGCLRREQPGPRKVSPGCDVVPPALEACRRGGHEAVKRDRGAETQQTVSWSNLTGGAVKEVTSGISRHLWWEYTTFSAGPSSPLFVVILSRSENQARRLASRQPLNVVSMLPHPPRFISTRHAYGHTQRSRSPGVGKSAGSSHFPLERTLSALAQENLVPTLTKHSLGEKPKEAAAPNGYGGLHIW